MVFFLSPIFRKSIDRHDSLGLLPRHGTCWLQQLSLATSTLPTPSAGRKSFLARRPPPPLHRDRRRHPAPPPGSRRSAAYCAHAIRQLGASALDLDGAAEVSRRLLHLGERQRRLLPKVGGAATTGRNVCYKRLAVLLLPLATSATTCWRCCYYRPRRLLQKASGAATTGRDICYHMLAALLLPAATSATKGWRCCYYRSRHLLPHAGGAATTGGEVCYHMLAALLLPATKSATTCWRRCYYRRRCLLRTGGSTATSSPVALLQMTATSASKRWCFYLRAAALLLRAATSATSAALLPPSRWRCYKRWRRCCKRRRLLRPSCYLRPAATMVVASEFYHRSQRQGGRSCGPSMCFICLCALFFSGVEWKTNKEYVDTCQLMKPGDREF
jgi:hypothetical protein